MSNIEYSTEHRTELQPTVQPVPIEVERIVTDAEKLDYLYQVALKVSALVESVTPAQIEQVQKLQRNPFLSKMFAGILPGNE